MEVTSPPGGPLSFGQRGQDRGGLAETPQASPAGQGMGWERLSPKEAAER